VPAAAQAGLEDALLASGLLTAVITADGAVRAADGELLFSAGSVRLARPLSTVLRPDSAATLPSATISLRATACPFTTTSTGTLRVLPIRARSRLQNGFW
jgi:hypothetical protein